MKTKFKELFNEGSQYMGSYKGIAIHFSTDEGRHVLDNLANLSRNPNKITVDQFVELIKKAIQYVLDNYKKDSLTYRYGVTFTKSKLKVPFKITLKNNDSFVMTVLAFSMYLKDCDKYFTLNEIAKIEDIEPPVLNEWTCKDDDDIGFHYAIQLTNYEGAETITGYEFFKLDC